MKDFNTLFTQAVAARMNAYAPYSIFLVGACIETERGNIYTGCNVENVSFGLTMCAEANAIGAMIIGGEYHIKQILIISEGPSMITPCGACRQRIAEFASMEMLIHLADLEGVKQTYTLADLLPHAFSPSHLSKTK